MYPVSVGRRAVIVEAEADGVGSEAGAGLVESHHRRWRWRWRWRRCVCGGEAAKRVGHERVDEEAAPVSLVEDDRGLAQGGLPQQDALRREAREVDGGAADGYVEGAAVELLGCAPRLAAHTHAAHAAGQKLGAAAVDVDLYRRGLDR